MADQPNGTPEERLERLEQAVAGIQARLDRLSDAKAPTPLATTDQPAASPAKGGRQEAVAAPRRIPPVAAGTRVLDWESSDAAQSPSPAAAPGRKTKSFKLPDVMRESEYWFNKIGIGLLLLGVVFLFKYSIDQGWITPAVRVGSGLAVGASLLAVGLRIHGKRRPFSQVLLGGGIAVLYTSGFAAFQLFALVSHTGAMAFMVSVTALAFALSLKQEEAMLSAIAALGGLGTPFLLYTGEGDLPGLVSYTCLLLGGASAVYFYRGWRTLLWVCVCGGWAVLSIGLIEGISGDPRQAIGDRWALQLGVAFAWLAFAVVPVLREVVCAAHPARWPRPSLGLAESVFEPAQLDLLQRHVHLVSISAPLAALAMSLEIWAQANHGIWGWIALGGSLAYGFASWMLKRRDGVGELGYTHAATGGLLLTISLCLLLDGDALLISLAAEALVLHLVARRLSDSVMRVGGHLLFGIVGGWLLQRLAAVGDGTPLINALALTDLCVIAIALMVAKVCAGRERTVYLLAANAAMALWLPRELSGNLLLVSLGAQACVLRLTARRLSSGAATISAHLLFGVPGIWLAVRLTSASVGAAAVFNTQALADIALVLAALGVSVVSVSSRERIGYRLCAHLAVLAWILREVGATGPNGQGYATIAWGCYAAALLVLGLRLNISGLSVAGVGTLLLVVAKLFLVDLVQLEAIWRILLFLGFGGIFLVISYYFQALWRREPTSSEQVA